MYVFACLRGLVDQVMGGLVCQVVGRGLVGQVVGDWLAR